MNFAYFASSESKVAWRQETEGLDPRENFPADCDSAT